MMDDDVPVEALRWAQSKLALIAALGEWASLGALITIETMCGQFAGYLAEWGSDWVSLQTSTAQVFLPVTSIEWAYATHADGLIGRYRAQSWLGVLRSLEVDGSAVGVQLRSGKQRSGVVAVVAQDHVRLLARADTDGALGPVVPIGAITAIWRLSKPGMSHCGRTEVGTATSQQSHP